MKWMYLIWFVGFGLQMCGEETLAQPPTKGSLLIAREGLSDPRFSETVVLLLQHDTGGSLGIMLNRPTWVTPTTVFPELDFLDDYEGHIYIGGPLQRSNILILSKGVGNLETDAILVMEDIYASSELDFLRLVTNFAKNESTLRLYTGHAEWGPQQLDQEIKRGDWHIIPAKPELIFASEPLKLWLQTLSSGSEITANLSIHMLPLVALMLN